MTSVRISSTIVNSHAEKIKKKLDDAGKAKLLALFGEWMVAQVRKNAMRDGAPSGSMAKLSGYNQGSKVLAKERIRQRKIGVLDDGKNGRDKHTAKHGVSRHAGYARQKEADKAAGKIAYGPDERWRRTGSLVESLVALVAVNANGGTISLDAEGTDSDGVKQSDKLKWLCRGTPVMPARDPTSDMSSFEARVESHLRKLFN